MHMLESDPTQPSPFHFILSHGLHREVALIYSKKKQVSEKH